jgi:DGQHR domain-containing protein
MSPGQTIKFSCIEVAQPIGTFYIGAIDSRDLVKISYSDVRRIERRAVEEYLGIERPLSPGRVAELRQYVNTIDATFPTSVILAIHPEKAEYDPATGTMSVANEEDVAKIIDGQHRIAGLESYAGKDAFQINATIFVDMDMEDQAMVFATINLKQTKVSKSLAYDLYEYANSRSPQKTSHNIAKLLNTRGGSPFRNKIKILGVATGKPEETLTQATFVDRLMKHISAEPMKDRDVIKRGKELKKVSKPEAEKFIFRNLFVDDKDAVIAKIVWNYFEAVADRWPHAWTVPERGNILCRATGFGALMRFMRDAYLHLVKTDPVVEMSAFRSLFQMVKLNDESFTSENFLPGSSGEAELYKVLKAETLTAK